jgi:hypothetical protein
VIEAIDSEREYQEQKWPGHCHSTAEYILIMEQCLLKAKTAWSGNSGDKMALHEVRQVVAVGVACMEDNGAPKRVV